eukprot:673912-Amphidinium_carterae.1
MQKDGPNSFYFKNGSKGAVLFASVVQIRIGQGWRIPCFSRRTLYLFNKVMRIVDLNGAFRFLIAFVDSKNTAYCIGRLVYLKSSKER